MNVIALTFAGGVWTDAGEPPVFVEFDWPLIIGLVVSVVLPLLVGLVTKYATNGRIKALLLAGLSAVTGLFTELGNALTNETPYNLGMGLVFALAAFIVGVGMHYGLYKPTGAATAAQKALGGDKGLPPVSRGAAI